ncbi:MAG: hypothetical protein FJ098_00615 [Deltaproteobacteria bacterium]|nr:hypothetical protein [Deltaproteobacteria bacterium]
MGTHRVTCRFVMSVGGPTHVAVFEFELLDPVEWITGTQYHGLVSTRRMYDESFIGAGTTRQALHRYIDQWSRDVEEKLGRIFGARYLTINVAGRDTPVLLLPEAILCTDQVQAVWKDTSGEEVTFAYDDQYYRVYNRHLDGKIPGEDDRYNPKLEVTGWTDPVAILGSFQWPWGRQNIQISGVWGFTDPEPHASGERVPLGKIPPEVQRVVATLVSRSIEDPTMSNPTVWSPGSIREYKTRDQSIKLGSGSGMTVAPDSPTGDPYLDRLLLRFAKPVTSDYSGKEHADL